MTVRPNFPGEHVDAMLARLKRAMQTEGVHASLKRHEAFTPAPERRRIKSFHAQRRRAK